MLVFTDADLSQQSEPAPLWPYLSVLVLCADIAAFSGVFQYAEAMLASSDSICIVLAAKCALGIIHFLVWLIYISATEGKQTYPNFWSLFLAMSCWISAILCVLVSQRLTLPEFRCKTLSPWALMSFSAIRYASGFAMMAYDLSHMTMVSPSTIFGGVLY